MHPHINQGHEEGEMKEALITLITERLGAGHWDRLPTGDLYRIFNNLKDNQNKEEARNGRVEGYCEKRT